MRETGKYAVNEAGGQLARLVYIICCFLFFIFLPSPAFCQQAEENAYDEISVMTNVQDIGIIEIPALIQERTVLMSVADLFSFLKIKSTLSTALDSISGFYITEDASFVIDQVNNKIFLSNNVHELKPGDLIRTETGLYLRSGLFGEIFALDCQFSFRSLMVTITTKLELPAIREMRQEQMRKNIGKLKGNSIVDTTLNQSYPLFNFGVLDWSVISLQQEKGQDQTMVNISSGAIIAGGETIFSLNYNSSREFKERDQYYLWRLANNDRPALRQVLAGKIPAQSISSIFAPVVGFQVTNTPTGIRKSFGSYTLSNTTQPGEIVELYVNDILVDYVKADAAGFYSFQVPLVYGNSEVKTKFYGSWGEERTKLENINIPFNFLPVGLFEYTISSGIVEDNLYSRFSRGNFNYGVTREWTIGGGVEHLSSVTSGNIMPFLNTSVKVGQSMILSGEYTYGVRTKGLLNYKWPSNVQLELQHIRYQPGQRAINVNFLEERKFAFSAPFRSRRLSLFTRFSANQFILPSTQYSTVEWLVSAAYRGVGAHVSTYAFYASSEPYVYSNFSLSFHLPRSIVVTPEVQYEYNNNKLMSMRWRAEKNIFRGGYIGFYYEQNFKSNYNNLGVDIRYDFSFAQLGLTARRVNNKSVFLQSARGSVRYEPKTNYTAFSSRTSVGRGNIEIIPFLDLNGNGNRERNEPKASGLKVHANGGRMSESRKDSCIRILDLEPYSNYFIDLDGTAFENISWRLGKKSMRVVVEPNKFKIVPVPIAVLAEISGKIYLADKNGAKGQGQVIVKFYKDDTTLVGKVLSEPDGYFGFLGLPYGSYTARVDSAQLQKLNMKASPASIPFNVSRNKEGDIISNIDFTLEAKKP